MYVTCAGTSMIPQLVTLTAISHREQHLKIYPTIGFARYAA